MKSGTETLTTRTIIARRTPTEEALKIDKK